MSNPYDEMRSMTLSEILRMIGLQALFFVAVGVGLWWFSGRNPLAFVTVDVRQIGLGLAFGLGLIAVALALFVSFPRFSEMLCREQAQNFAFLEKGFSMPAIIFVSLCAGIGEEALFRAGLQTLLSDYLPISAAILISATLFTLIHFSKPIIAALIFVIGCAFGIVYWLTESLLAVMIAHAVYDVFAIWYLQRELNRLGLFNSDRTQTLDEVPVER